MKKFLRVTHRWLGLLMALQLLAWLGSGFYFALFPIDEIRGDHLVEEPAPLQAADLDDLIGPGEAWGRAAAEFEGAPTLEGVAVVERGGRTWYRIAGAVGDEHFVRLVDGSDGTVAPRLGEQDARRIAENALTVPGTVTRVELMTEPEPGSEYRGHLLPLWRVTFDSPEALHLYVDPWTREIVAQRTGRWRIFDFLWMLHIMDWNEREEFHTLLLQSAAALGLIIVLSGVGYWLATSRSVRRFRRTPPH